MLLSIVLPTYNVKDYLAEGVASLTGQSFQTIEILLVDDGSTDGTGLLCDELAQRDSRIRVFHKENGGASSARNMGIREAKGDYIMFMDPDDWLDTDAFETLLPLIEENDLDIIRFSYVREFGHTSAKKRNTFVKNGLSVAAECETVCRQTLGLVGQELAHPENMNFLASACFCLYRKSIIDENSLSFYDYRKIAGFSDGLFNICFLRHAERFYYIDEPFYHYRKFTAGAATSSYRENFLERQMLLFGMLRQVAEQAADPIFMTAYQNRVIFSTMELCLNVLKSQKSFGTQYGEIRQILKNPEHRQAYKHLDLKPLPIKWKVYYFLVKSGMTLPVLAMTKVIRFLQRKG